MSDSDYQVSAWLIHSGSKVHFRCILTASSGAFAPCIDLCYQLQADLLLLLLFSPTPTATAVQYEQPYGEAAGDGAFDEAYKAALEPFWRAQKQEISQASTDISEYKSQQLPLARIKKVH
jgi:hypothetical protein